ncbi:MAG TPA: archease [Candidatus Eisenbacteria bacterium]|nr:archease [Candidatus Eisenbacteria bacterium]
MRAEEGFETFDHTGDLGLEVWAPSPERLFARAALAVLAQVAEADGHADEVRVHIAREAGVPGDLLVDLCNAALLEAEVLGAVWTEARVTLSAPGRLDAELSGPRRDPRRQVFLREIKAVSLHDLELDLTPGRCRCRLVLDV